MIFERSILREKIGLTVVIFFTLFTIITVFVLVRSLNQVNQGNIALNVLLKYLLVVALSYFPLIMVATTMIAMINTISRLYKDSEMVVWQTSGVSQWAIFRPVWMLIVPMFLFLLFMNAVLVPWTNQKLAAYQANSTANQLNLFKSGSFQSTKNGERTIFVGQVHTGVLPEFEQLFMQQSHEGKNILLLAQSAKVSNGLDGRSFLNLNNGRQYLLTPPHSAGQSEPSDKTPAIDSQNIKNDINEPVADFTVNSMRFEQYSVALDDLVNVDTRTLHETPVDQLDSVALWHRPTAEARAALYRRFSDAWMIVPMAIFAVVLGYIRPRSTRTWGILAGIALLMIYLNFIKVGEGSIASGKSKLLTVMLTVHGGFLLAALFCLWYRFNSWRLPALSLSALRLKKFGGGSV